MNNLPYSLIAVKIFVKYWEKSTSDYIRGLELQFANQHDFDTNPKKLYEFAMSRVYAQYEPTPHSPAIAIVRIIKLLEQAMAQHRTGGDEERELISRLYKTHTALVRGMATLEKLLADPRTSGGAIFGRSEYTTPGCLDRYLNSVTLQTVVADSWWITNMSEYTREPEFDVFRLFSDKSFADRYTSSPPLPSREDRRKMEANSDKLASLRTHVRDTLQKVEAWKTQIERALTDNVYPAVAKYDSRVLTRATIQEKINKKSDRLSRSLRDQDWSISLEDDAVGWKERITKKVKRLRLGYIEYLRGTSRDWKTDFSGIYKELNRKRTDKPNQERAKEFLDAFADRIMHVHETEYSEKALVVCNRILQTKVLNSETEINDIINSWNEIATKSDDIDEKKTNVLLDLYIDSFDEPISLEVEDVRLGMMRVVERYKDQEMDIDKFNQDLLNAIKTFDDFPHVKTHKEEQEKSVADMIQVRSSDIKRTMSRTRRLVQDTLIPQADLYIDEARQEKNKAINDTSDIIRAMDDINLSEIDGSRIVIKVPDAVKWAASLKKYCITPIEANNTNITSALRTTNIQSMQMLVNVANSANSQEIIVIQFGITATQAAMYSALPHT